MTKKQPLPTPYRNMAEEEILERIWIARRTLGDRLVLLGHHYQRDSVIQFADFRGDSLKLAQLAATQRDAEAIVFCGVHFMAESADILSADNQIVILPDLTAGCPMADMADISQVSTCWEQLTAVMSDTIVPVTYVNSSAVIKAFTGRHGGLTCTSSNAMHAMEWAFKQGRHILFLPDQHLGRNTAYAMGIPLDQMVLWDPDKPLGGNTPKEMDNARIILWKGHCYVHQMFKTSHVKHFRKIDPEMKIIVHPECEFDVVQAADLSGSTSMIIKAVEESEPGSRWAVGTEIHLVERLAKSFPDRTVVPLTRFGSFCATMYRIDLPHLLWALESLLSGQAVNVIKVQEKIAHNARLALNRMLEISR